MEKVYVIGHLTPDTDTIVSAMSLAAFLNMKEKTDRYVPAMTGNPNSETEYLFSRFNAKFPEIVEDASDKKMFLVDHNEASQWVKGAKVENILGFVDHHKIKFECPAPIFIVARPWGSTNSIVYNMFKKNNLEVPQDLRPLMLAALLSDTVILKSPTTTPNEMAIVDELSAELNINFEELGMEMFKAKSMVSKKTPMEIIKNDFKNFDFKGKKTGIGQIETPDLKEIEARASEILGEMKQLKDNEGYHSLVLMLTDILQEGSKLLVVSDELDNIAGMFKIEFKDNLSSFVPGMMSRKKQVAPILDSNL